MSVIFDNAVSTYSRCRQEFEDYLQHAYAKAEEATRGRMLNRKAEHKGIDSYSLFLSNQSRANAYASEELRDYWREHPRMTFEQFERQWFDSQEYER